MKEQYNRLDSFIKFMTRDDVMQKAQELQNLKIANQFKKYINDVPDSKISAIWTHFAKPYPYTKFFVEYKSQPIEAHNFLYISDFFNKSKSDPEMALSASLMEGVLRNSYGMLAKDNSSGGYLPINEDISSNFYCVQKKASTDEEQKLLNIPITHVPWYKFQDNFESMVKAGHELLSQSSQSRIFSLGQSPAWIVKAAECLSNLKHKAQYIPFSGKFYDRVEKEGGADISMEPRALGPTDQQKELYQNVLNELDLNPQKISKLFELNGTKTTILDYVETAGGITSFLSLLFSFAQKEGIDIESLKSALDIVLLVEDKSYEVNSITFDDTKVICKNQIVRDISALTCTVDKGQYSDRLVPHYPYVKWEAAPEPTEGSATFIQGLISRMEATSAQYINSLHPAIESIETNNNTTSCDNFSDQGDISVVGNIDALDSTI